MRKKNTPLYPVLEQEIRDRHIKKREIAESLYISQDSLSRKLRGTRGLSLDEAIAVHEWWFMDIPIEILFQKE